MIVDFHNVVSEHKKMVYGSYRFPLVLVKRCKIYVSFYGQFFDWLKIPVEWVLVLSVQIDSGHCAGYKNV